MATFFSPFTPINQFSQDELSKEPQSKGGVLDMSKALKGGQADKIKKLEQEIQNYKDLQSKLDKKT